MLKSILFCQPCSKLVYKIGSIYCSNNIGPYDSLALNLIMHVMGQFEPKIQNAIGPSEVLRNIAYRLLRASLSVTHYFKGSETRRRNGVEGDWSKGAARRRWGGRGKRRGEAGASRLGTTTGGLLLTGRELWRAPVWGMTREQSKDCSPKFVGLIY